MFSIISPLYSMNSLQQARAPREISSLRDLCAKKIWEYRESYIPVDARGYLQWGEISPYLRLDILQQCEVTPETLMFVLKNSNDDGKGITNNNNQIVAKDKSTHDSHLIIGANKYFDRVAKVMQGMSRVTLMRMLEKEALPFKPIDKRRELITGYLTEHGFASLPEVIIPFLARLQSSENVFIRALGNVPRADPSDKHGQLLVEGRDDLKVHVTNLESGEHQEFNGHEQLLTNVKLNRHNTIAASGDAGGNVWCWDLRREKGTHIGRHFGPICGIKFHGPLVASFATDKTVRIYNIMTGILIKLHGEEQQITGIDFNESAPEIKIHLHNHTVSQSIPFKYLSGELTAEQIIIAQAIKTLQTSKAKKEDIECVKRVLKKKEYEFEPQIQKYFEELSNSLKSEDDEV